MNFLFFYPFGFSFYFYFLSPSYCFAVFLYFISLSFPPLYQLAKNISSHIPLRPYRVKHVLSVVLRGPFSV